MAAEEQKNVLGEDSTSEVQSDGEIFTDDAHEESLKADIEQSDLGTACRRTPTAAKIESL